MEDHQAGRAFARERVVRPELDYILAALVDPLNDYERNIDLAPASGFIRDKVFVPSPGTRSLANYDTAFATLQELYDQFSGTWTTTDGNLVERGRIGPNGTIVGSFTGGRRGAVGGATTGHDTPGNRVRNSMTPATMTADTSIFPLVDNHNFPNSWFPSNRYPFSSRVSTTARDWRSLQGDSMENIVGETINGVLMNAVADRATDTITFTGSTHEDVYNQFQIYAQEFLFHDGLPLVPPTPELVNEMLTGTIRGRDEVIGRHVPGRSGATTVEKIAINAVMAGALPEHLPIILGAVELWAQAEDNRQVHFHGLTSGGPFSYGLFISGPIVEELGLNTGAGYLGGPGSVNAAIGRATRLNTRNLANQWLGYQDTPRIGRLHEISHQVIAENDSAVPTGWLTYREQLGFAHEHSIVTIHSMGNNNMLHMDSSGVDQAWSAQDLIHHLRSQDERGNDSKVVIGPAHAQALFDAGWTDNTWLMQDNTIQSRHPAAPGNLGLGNNNTVWGQTAAGVANASTYIIVSGEDPTRATKYSSQTHPVGQTSGSVRITGAPLSDVVNCDAPPAPPVNFTVTPGPMPGEATLSWDAPTVTAGRRAITHFEVTAQFERNDLRRWVQVPGGAEATSVTLRHLDGGLEYSFFVRAVSGSYEQTAPANMYFNSGRRVPLVNDAPVANAGVVVHHPVNIYTAWDTDAFPTGQGTAGNQRGVVPARGSIASVHWSAFNNVSHNGVANTAPGEVFFITAQLNADETSIDVQWRPPFSDGGSAITGYEFSTDNGVTWALMDATTGRDLVMPNAVGASVSSAGVRHNGSFTIEVCSADGDPLAPAAGNVTYDILVRAVNDVGEGTHAGQLPAESVGRAWPFRTAHRGPADVNPFPTATHPNPPAGAINNAFVQAVSRVRVTVSGLGLSLELDEVCVCDTDYCICEEDCTCDTNYCECEKITTDSDIIDSDSSDSDYADSDYVDSDYVDEESDDGEYCYELWIPDECIDPWDWDVEEVDDND